MTGEDKIMIYLEGHNQPMRTESHKHSEKTDKIIKAFYSVYNKPGYGFPEKVYENALKIEIKTGIQSRIAGFGKSLLR
jgi:hypothetical protein